MEESQVADWYKDQHIFVTGATGFMGKILIEKLLRSCPGIGGIYILIRQKKEQEPSKRLLEYLKNPIFDKIRSLPDSTSRFQKLHCVCGDVTKADCALSDADTAALSEKITIVFHMAACVRFDQPLKDIVMMNVGGTRNVLDVATKFQQLKVFLHVSTSYCHLDLPELEEKIYPAKHDPWKMLDAVQWMDEDMLRSLTSVVLKGYPNTYAYAKCLTEQLVSNYSEKLPIVITRPSIVVAAYKEPIPGWVDNINGPTGILIGAGKGVIRTMHCNTKLVADVVPVDMVINSMLLATWEQGIKQLKTGVEVYNVTANMDQPWSWGEALEMGRKYVFQYPYSTCLWYPGGSPKSSYLVHVVAAFFFHLLPAYFIDFIMTLTGNKPFMVRTQKRIQQGLNLLQYYTTRTWIFHNEKIKRVYDSLSEKDKEIFYTNRERLQYDEYMLNYILGARRYCVKEGDETVPYARKVLKRLYYLDMLKNIVLFALLLWIAHALATTFLLKANSTS
ncbi:unnamed protein product [Callosobruchus maculatus]|uniref:Fatty acyl-CoA reductase n=1 Tax=Callosobruchus maculatus TaxID=64391 RepID=A0A653CNJ9_CALMS|nr:unnamed protein product [Callosobruchus maculatus]